MDALTKAGFFYAAAGLAERVADEKRGNRAALAAMLPREAQRLVSTGIPVGKTRIVVRGVPERSSLGLTGLTGADD